MCSTQKSSVLEYKPIENGDDGWYIVFISLRDGFKVVVKYERLAEEREEEIELGKLRSAEDLFVTFPHSIFNLRGGATELCTQILRSFELCQIELVASFFW